nr:discoidin domain-containing protein [Candidatus Poseidoniaceae archaeon]
PDSAEVGAETDPLNNQSYASDYFTDWNHNLVQEVSLSASASSTASGYSPSNTIDDDYQTSWWSNGECPQWIEIDLGGVFRVAHIGATFDVNDDHPWELDVYVRENISDPWTTLVSLQHSENYDLAYGFSEYVVPKKTRYIRFDCLDSTDDGGTVHAIGIRSINIYDSRFTQFADLDAIDNYSGIGGAGQSGVQPSISAHLEIDSLNETLYAAYSFFDLNVGEDYDVVWRLIEAEQGNCPGVPEIIDSGGLYIMDWDSAQQGQIVSLIDYGPDDDEWPYAYLIDWYGEYCLQLELSQDGTSIDDEWLYLNASSGQSSGSNSDVDGDGVDDTVDLCLGTPTGTEVDADGCPLGSGVDPTSILDVEFNERQEDSVWYQSFTVLIDDPWLGFNHSMSLKFNDENGNTLFSYFSPMDDEDSQGGWWRLSTDMDENPEEWNLDLNWEGLTSG